LFHSHPFRKTNPRYNYANEYILKGDKQKAASNFFATLQRMTPTFHSSITHYLNTLLDLNEAAEAAAYLKKLLRERS
jgi:predicted Zn-dependent protease